MKQKRILGVTVDDDLTFASHIDSKTEKAFKALKSGLSGYVTGGGNPFPEFLVSIYRYFQESDLNSAEKAQATLDLWLDFRKQSSLSEIAITKVALRTRIESFPTFVRLPLLLSEPTLLEPIELFVKKKILSLL